MDKFGAIPVFVTVVEKGSFSAAAQALGISKSAVSKRINQLEADLGVRLLHRTTRKLSLSEAGERYVEYATQAVLAANQAEDAVTELQGEPQGHLRINAPMSFGRLHIAPVIPQLLKRFPKLRIDLVLDDRKVDLIASGFDVAVRAGNLPVSSLVARKLAPLRQVICASRTYIEQFGEPIAPADLSRHNCVLYSYSSDAGKWILTKDGVPVSVPISGSYQVNNSEALLEALRAGIGVGRLPTFVAAPDLRTGKLIRILRPYAVPELSIYAVFPERQFLPAKVRAFLDFAVESFGGDQPFWDR